jgi:hypothetical protein
MNHADHLRLVIPIYDLAMSSFVTSVVDGIVGLEPMLGQIPVRTTGHAGPTRNVPGPQPVDHPLQTFQQTVTIHADVIRTTDVGTFLDALYDLAKQYEAQMGEALIRSISDVTEAVGNVVNAQGRPLSYDFFLDALEKIEVTFYEDGRPRVPQVAGHPETAKLLRAVEITSAQRRREEAIFRRKKDEWDAQKRTRRLPRPDQGAGV